MSLEIERKFLVCTDDWRRQAARSSSLRQGYLANTARCSVRLRLAQGEAWLSVKAMRAGPVREEYEYPVPAADAAQMLASLAEGLLVEKIRHDVPIREHHFEVDEFQGANRGLVIAEIELDRPDAPFPQPPWLGDEVTDDGRFHNFRLAQEPFERWPEALRAAARNGRLAGNHRP